MSNPSGLPVEGFLLPMPGWSYFTPILILPALLSLSIVLPAGKLGLATTSYASEPVLPLVPPPTSVLLSPQAVSASASVATPAARMRFRIGGFLSGDSVSEDLGQKVLRPVALRGIEELV